MDRKILEKRLIDFSNNVMHFCLEAKFDKLSIHLAKQIVWSSSSCALKYTGGTLSGIYDLRFTIYDLRS